MTDLERASKDERNLIKSEEKAEKLFLKACKQHGKAARRLTEAEDTRQKAEERLRVAQLARAAGPTGPEKTADA